MAVSNILKLKCQISKLMSNVDKDQGQGLDILKILNNMYISLDVLSSTGIAATVNKFRKFSKDKEIQTFAKSLIKKWTKQLEDESSTNGKSTKNSNNKIAERIKEVRKTIENKKNQTQIAKPSKKLENGCCNVMSDNNMQQLPNTASTNGETVKNSNCEIAKTTEKVEKKKKPYKKRNTISNLMSDDLIRSKSRSMLCDSLVGDEVWNDQINIKQLVYELEESIFSVFKNTGRPYKNRIRSRYFNFKDQRNPNLRQNFLSGSIAPARMAVLSHEEMASDEMKKLRASYKKQGIDKSRMAMVEGTSSNLLQCGKCKKRDCCYNQVQTRSADEPMTTFVLCNNCGNRWKC